MTERPKHCRQPSHDETLYTTMPPTTLSKNDTPYQRGSLAAAFSTLQHRSRAQHRGTYTAVTGNRHHPPSWHGAFLFYRRKLGCLILWWRQPTELGVGVGDRKLRSRSSWIVEAVQSCMHFKSSPDPAVEKRVQTTLLLV